ncbi:hypothetical protein DBZ36_05920 [Alginatibacterium sediminis]|uniref:Outer membrane protein beta-barrel domain-containing protein n=1 Tax=Alginatibacterium sediminis TaxID=2164068 RepID=A0A420EH41_9ALTE|nr:hypothetical protein [Alginatibacterium sediminis]RKF19987.1 hypothetical protein DBZ36_05920 [Alginatibacterium sediminis]
MPHKGTFATLVLVSGLTGAPSLVSASTLPMSNWEHSFELYALALNIEGDSALGPLSPTIDVDTRFIMDNFDKGLMFRLEGIRNNTWGYYFDYSFMDLSAKTSGPGNLVTGGFKLRQGVLEAKGFKRYDYGYASIDYMLGLRWWDNDIETSLNGPAAGAGLSREIKEDWLDFVIGVRWIRPLSDSWNFYIYGDAGLGKDTNSTYALQTGFRYEMNDWSDINLSYKSTWVDYDNKDNFAYDTKSHGFLIGLGLKF